MKPSKGVLYLFSEAFLISSLINPKVFNKKGSGIPNKEVRR
jgi:hypothetical protein